MALALAGCATETTTDKPASSSSVPAAPGSSAVVPATGPRPELANYGVPGNHGFTVSYPAPTTGTNACLPLCHRWRMGRRTRDHCDIRPSPGCLRGMGTLRRSRARGPPRSVVSSWRAYSRHCAERLTDCVLLVRQSPRRRRSSNPYAGPSFLRIFECVTRGRPLSLAAILRFPVRHLRKRGRHPGGPS